MCSVSFISMGLVISHLFISTEPRVCWIYFVVVLVLGSVPGVFIFSLSLQGSSHTPSSTFPSQVFWAAALTRSAEQEIVVVWPVEEESVQIGAHLAGRTRRVGSGRVGSSAAAAGRGQRGHGSRMEKCWKWSGTGGHTRLLSQISASLRPVTTARRTEHQNLCLPPGNKSSNN